MNREIENSFIFGENGALELAEKAQGFFLLNAHNISTPEGDIVINNVGSVKNRAYFFVEDTLRRYGFDIATFFIFPLKRYAWLN